MCKGAGCGKGHKLRDALASITIGAYKLAKAFLGVDPAPKAVVEFRRAICRECPYAVPCQLKPGKKCWCGPVWDSVWGERETCGCNIEYKTLVASEACPKGFWPAVPSAMAPAGPETPPRGPHSDPQTTQNTLPPL